VKRFLQRYDKLDAKIGTRLDRQQALADNPEVLKKYYNKVRNLIKSYNNIISVENIYNIDEKCFMMGVAVHCKVI
ncbi:hypothetical protein HOY82DRAFT_461655, partial [Tuber indicum]